MKTNLLSLVMVCALASARAETNAVRHSCCAAKMTENAPACFTGKSLYQLDSTWTNDAGKAVTLASLRGRPQIVAMFFANCTYACPLLVYQMQQIEATLPMSVRTNVGFTLVSFDSERDTPAALSAYRLAHKLDDGRWTLLRGSPGEVLELGALLNVKFKKDSQGQFQHSNVITLLNADGEIAYQQLGLNTDSGELLRRASELVRPQPNAGVARPFLSVASPQ